MPVITFHNIETDEIIERELNAKELKQWESEQAAILALESAEAKKAADKAALLAKLGINEDEARLLLG